MSIETQTLGSPVNKTAARVTYRGFNHRYHTKDPCHYHWDAPQRLRDSVESDEKEFIGKTQGRLTVVGKMMGDKKERWLVRCVCGMYEPRTAKAITNPRNQHDACVECRTLEQRKYHAAKNVFYAKHGVYPNESSGPEAKAIMRRFEGAHGEY